MFWEDRELEVPSCVPCARVNYNKVYLSVNPVFHYDGVEFNTLHDVLDYSFNVMKNVRHPLGEVDTCLMCSNFAVHKFHEKYLGTMSVAGFSCMEHFEDALIMLSSVYCRVEANNAFLPIPKSWLPRTWADI